MMCESDCKKMLSRAQFFQLVAWTAMVIGTTVAVCNFWIVKPLERHIAFLQSQLSAKQQITNLKKSSNEQDVALKKLAKMLALADLEAAKNQADEERKNRLAVLEVIIHTTRDDKDAPDTVTLEVRNGSGILVTRQAWTGAKLDNNTTAIQTLVMPTGTKVTDNLELIVRKTGTDGWIFHAAAVGQLGDGNRVELLPRSGEHHFEDDPDASATFKLSK